MKILVTRPEPGATATAARLIALGHEPILAPCLEIVHTAWRLDAEPAALIITSAQAIPALPSALHNTPVFCVGDATAAKLRAAGFTRVESASGDAEALFHLITARHLPGLHVMAVGQRHGLALANRLRAAGISVLRRTVYKANPLKIFSEAARNALANRKIGAALFYSADSARAFLRLRPPHTETITAYALSPAVAQPLHILPWREIHVAVSPTEADLLSLMPHA